MSDKLTRLEHGAIENPAAAPMDIEALFQYAVKEKAGVEVIERMMGVRRELRAEKAKEDFDRAMAELQAEMPVIERNTAVSTGEGKVAYKYASFESVVAVMKPYLQKHGFSYTLDTDVESKDGWVIAKCRVTHAGGHFQDSTAKFPLGAGTRLMSTTQVYAAALTFASRRVFQNAFGIVTSGEDQNGMTERAKPAGPSAMAPANQGVKELAKELWDVLAEVRGTERNWDEANNWLWREDILDGAVPEKAPQLNAKRFREVIEAARKKLAK